MSRTVVSWLMCAGVGLAVVAAGLGPGLAAAQVPPGGSGAQPLPVTQMGQGVYGIKAPGEDMNTGFVVGDDGVFVFACNLNTFDARIAAIRTITDKPIRWAGNGHAAADDYSCNFDLKRMGATLFGSERMRENFLEIAPPRLVADLRTPAGQQLWQGRSLAAPEITFGDKLVLHLGEARDVHLMYMGKGHTIGDAVTYMPDQRVLFTADLLFVELHPTVRDGDSANWQRILARLMGMDVDWIVPGHGPMVQGKEQLQVLSDYFDTVRARVRALMQQGKTLDQIRTEIDLSEYSGWGRQNSVPETLEKLYRELGGTAS